MSVRAAYLLSIGQGFTAPSPHRVGPVAAGRAMAASISKWRHEALGAYPDKTGSFQQLDVLGNGGPADGETVSDGIDAGRLSCQLPEDLPSLRIGQSQKNIRVRGCTHTD